MDANERIDWDVAWREAFLARMPESANPEYWDSRADLFQNQSRCDHYTYLILQHLRVGRKQSVLDVGCGVGNLTIPLARRASRVTALDVSEPMLNYLRANAEKAALKNIETIRMNWLEARIGHDVPLHDVVVCSCAAVTPQVKTLIEKLHEAARRKVYLSWEIEHSFQAAVFRALGRPVRGYPNYIYLYNLLYQLGIPAKVKVLKSAKQVQFADLDTALANWRSRLRLLADEEEERLRDFFQRELVFSKSRWIPRRTYYSSWALMSWRK